MAKLSVYKFSLNRFYFNFIFVLLALVINAANVDAQSAVTVFSENFDNSATAQPWSPYYSTGWINPSTTVQSVNGKGKVLKAVFPASTVGVDHGFGNYRIPLNAAYKELYFSWEYFVPSDFDYGFADNLGGGKFFGGFAGGSMTAIPNNDATDVDGWVSIFIFQNGTFRTYNYFKGSSYSGGWPTGDLVANIVKGQWRRLTIRMKINDGDQSNGLFEVFDNDKLVYQKTNAKIVNSSHPEYLIEHLYLNSFFGGSGTSYVSPKTQSMMFDNLVAFYYPEGSTGYRSGASEAGRTLIVPQAASYHPEPPNRFIPSTYTDANGTINSHCEFYQPVNHPEGFQASQIQIKGATNININVTKFNYDKGIRYQGYKQILRIYQGTGASRILKKTFESGVNTNPGSVAISGNSATIEWQAGQGSHNGFTLNYTSNGTGSGMNLSCEDAGLQEENKQIPVAPGALTYSNLSEGSVTLNWTDNSQNEDEFEIERKGIQSGDVLLFKAAKDQTTIENSDLVPNTTYTYRIRAINTAGTSDYSEALSLTTKSADGIPTEDEFMTSEHLLIYPNPSSGIVTIATYIDAHTVESDAPLQNPVLKVTDMSGNVVYSSSVSVVKDTMFKHTLDLSKIKQGLYFISLTYSNKNIKAKLIINR